MDRAGEKLKRARERLRLTYRDVEQASQTIAARHGSDEFAIALSRLADIENKGTLPTIYRLYTLCAIYRLDVREVMGWYGVPSEQLQNDAFHIPLAHTHPVQFPPAEARAPRAQAQNAGTELEKTAPLRAPDCWDKVPIAFLNGAGQRHYRYGLIGTADWSMYPLLQPGSLVIIDQNRRKIAKNGWTSEHSRPIYFLEHREGYICAWCSLADGRLLTQPHPASQQAPACFAYPSEIEVVGQVVGVATHLPPTSSHATRS